MFRTTIRIKKTSPLAVTPTQTEGNVGFDLHSIEDILVPYGETRIIKTGLQLASIPLLEDKLNKFSLLLKIEDRSGLASSLIYPVGRIVDPNYRGDISVCLFNSAKPENYNSFGKFKDKFKENGFLVGVGDRIAQIVIYPVVANQSNHFVSFKDVEWQQKSNRGTGGFGSSGT